MKAEVDQSFPPNRTETKTKNNQSNPKAHQRQETEQQLINIYFYKLFGDKVTLA